MTSAGGYKPSQLAQVLLSTIVKAAALCSCTLGVLFARLSAELRNSISVEGKNSGPSEQAQEVKLNDPARSTRLL